MGIDTKLKEDSYPFSATTVKKVVLQFGMNRSGHLSFEFFNQGSGQMVPRPPVQGGTVRIWIEQSDDGVVWTQFGAVASQDVVPFGKVYFNGRSEKHWRVQAQITVGAGQNVQCLVKSDNTLNLTQFL